jgi:ribosome biogenesis GTPase
MSTHRSLVQLGWSPFFQQQLSLVEYEHSTIWRVVGQHRSRLEIESETGTATLPYTQSMPKLTAGDWILLDSSKRFQRALERLSCFSRKAAGIKAESQLIAANIDTLFIVTSLNEEFNLNRIERYLVIASEAHVEAVIILTKIDLIDNPDSFHQQIASLDPTLPVVAVDGRDITSVGALNPWCTAGKTIALLGSSGVGKSTLVNTLSGSLMQATASIRVSDAKGRHTTSARSLNFLPSGAILLDTPGMRELQLYDCEEGIDQSFSDIIKLALHCRFSDCRHQGEPGCAVQLAVQQGHLEKRRLDNYLKLLREDLHNSSTIAEKRAKDRALGRYYRNTLKASQKLKQGPC